MTSRTNRGFTLIEVMLVALIIAFVAAIAIPSFVSSLKGQRLRSATRTVMNSGQYARTMAVSRQRNMNLVFTVGGNRLVIEEGPAVRAYSAPPVYTREQIDALSTGGPMAEPLPAAETPPSREEGRPLNLSRELEGVTIKRLIIRDGLQSEEGAASILYKRNGTCPPYEVVLADEEGTESSIQVDFLGEATHEER